MIKEGSYFLICDWMVTKLKLEGKELLLFALIHNFTKNYGCYRGTLSYLEEWLSSSRPVIIGWLKDLVDKGYISKTKSGGCSFEYMSKILTPVVKKTDYSCKEILHPDVKKSYTENNINNKKYNKDISDRRGRAYIKDPGAGSFDTEEFFRAALKRSYGDKINTDTI